LDIVFTVTLPFFALIGCGYAAARLGAFPQAGIPGLNVFVWYFALPSLVFRALALRPLAEILDVPYIAAWAVGGWVVYLVTATLGRLLFKVRFGAALLQGQGAELSNIGYMGLPMLIALFGEPATVPAVLAMLTDMVLVQTPTMALLEVARNREGHPITVTWKVIKGFATNPLVLAVAAGGVVAAFRLELPAPVNAFTDLLGRAAGPCALFAIGAKLAGQPVADRFGEVALVVFGNGAPPLPSWRRLTATLAWTPKRTISPSWRRPCRTAELFVSPRRSCV
jgi:predicted permease